MKFEFREIRAAQAMAQLLKRAPHQRAERTKLVNMLYLADRESLKELGAPMAGASFSSGQDGLMASDISDVIRTPGTAWHEYIVTDGCFIHLVGDPGDGELSDYGVDLLTALWTEHGHRSVKEVLDHVRGLPEWTGSSGSLEPTDILKAAGVEAAAIADMCALNRVIADFDALWGGE